MGWNGAPDNPDYYFHGDEIAHQEGGGGQGGHSCEAGQVHGVGIIGRGGRVDGDVCVVGVHVVRVGR